MFEKSGHSGADTGLKRAQVTLFIILAIVLVGVIIISFFSAGPRFSFQQQSGLSFENCVVDASKQAITELSKSGGEADPSFYYEYQGTRIPYYCSVSYTHLTLPTK